jgi:hypothetical protein
MSEKPSLPPLPPQSFEALREVGVIEDYVQDALWDCGDNPEKASRIPRTGVVESLNVQMDYYSSLPNYHSVWNLEVAGKTIDALIALTPPLTLGEQCRGELLRTAVAHLIQRLGATKNRTATAAPPKPVLVPSEPASPSQQKSTPNVQGSVAESVKVGNNEDIARRSKLLYEYEAATRNPSNKQIYEARNSRIHKPEFYQWVNGTLPANSATTANFERFLREKKPPIPKKPKD